MIVLTLLWVGRCSLSFKGEQKEAGRKAGDTAISVEVFPNEDTRHNVSPATSRTVGLPCARHGAQCFIYLFCFIYRSYQLCGRCCKYPHLTDKETEP